MSQDIKLRILELAVVHTPDPFNADAVVATARTFESFVLDSQPILDAHERLNAKAPASATSTAAQATPQPAASSTPQAEAPAQTPAPAATGKTVDDCRAAFQRYVERGNGRTAGKFMAEVMEPRFGARGIRQVAPERLDELYAAFEAA